MHLWNLKLHPTNVINFFVLTIFENVLTFDILLDRGFSINKSKPTFANFIAIGMWCTVSLVIKPTSGFSKRHLSKVSKILIFLWFDKYDLVCFE
jgi:hypothetical protein